MKCIKVGYVKRIEGVLAVRCRDADHCIKGPDRGTTESNTDVFSQPSGTMLQWTYLRDKDKVYSVAHKSRVSTIYNASFKVFLKDIR